MQTPKYDDSSLITPTYDLYLVDEKHCFYKSNCSHYDRDLWDNKGRLLRATLWRWTWQMFCFAEQSAAYIYKRVTLTRCSLKHFRSDPLTVGWGVQVYTVCVWFRSTFSRGWLIFTHRSCLWFMYSWTHKCVFISIIKVSHTAALL